MYASYEPYVEASDDWLAKVCQTSLFFALVSSIALKMEPDSAVDALGVLLLITAAVPPVIAFLFGSGLDFEKGCHISKIKKGLMDCFRHTLGRCLNRLFARRDTKGNSVVPSRGVAYDVDNAIKGSEGTAAKKAEAEGDVVVQQMP